MLLGGYESIPVVERSSVILLDRTRRYDFNLSLYVFNLTYIVIDCFSVFCKMCSDFRQHGLSLTYICCYILIFPNYSSALTHGTGTTTGTGTVKHMKTGTDPELKCDIYRLTTCPWRIYQPGPAYRPGTCWIRVYSVHD